MTYLYIFIPQFIDKNGYRIKWVISFTSRHVEIFLLLSTDTRTLSLAQPRSGGLSSNWRATDPGERRTNKSSNFKIKIHK